MLLLNDCLNELKLIKSQSVDMIYLDPPFFTQGTLKGVTKEGTEIFFDDKWKDITSYIDFLRERLVEMKRVLKNSGSLFFHCDKKASHYIRVMLDEVFGYQSFQSEIIWTYRRWSNSKKGLLNAHQNIFFYTKTADFKFNTVYTDYSLTTNVDQILQLREKNERGKSAYKMDGNGNVRLCKTKKGVPLSDVWDIPFLNPKASERTGYPTQKPIILLERIIDISTNENDLILDPFCGSGTTLVAAKLKGRNFIGIDNSAKAIEIASNRLDNPFKTKSRLLEKGIRSYNTKSKTEMHILKKLGAVVVQRNSGIDGFITDSEENGLIAVKIQKGNEDIKTACAKLSVAAMAKGCKKMIFIGNSNVADMACFDNKNMKFICLDECI